MNAQPTNDAVDALFKRYARPGSPGCAVAVLSDGEILYKQGYGLANVEHSVPVLPSTVFDIGSMAKQFTAFAVALLERDRVLSFDDDIRTYLPEMHDFGAPITVRHLLHHTSGLRGSFPELLALGGWRDTDSTTTDDVFRLLAAQRELNSQPGEEYLYVNSGYLLLAVICQRASGQSLAEFSQERIFDPLGMARTTINDSIVKLIPGRAAGYYEGEGGEWINAPLTDAVVGPTNVYSTVEDLANWDENFYTGEVGGRALLEEMHRPGRLNDGAELDYAFGLMVGPSHRHRGWDLVEHGGGQGGYGSYMLRFPDLHLSVVVLFNHFLWNMREYAAGVADLFLEDNPDALAASTDGAPSNSATEPAVAGTAPSPERLQSMCGKYFDARRAALRELTIAGGRLRYEGFDLVPTSETSFYVELEPEAHVHFAPGSATTRASITTRTTASDITYHRVDVTEPSPADLAGFAGRYYSPELDLSWSLVAQKHGLVAKRWKYVDTVLTPLFTDAFSDDWQPIMGYPTSYTVLFERDETGAVTGFRVSGTRVRSLLFVRQQAS